VIDLLFPEWYINEMQSLSVYSFTEHTFELHLHYCTYHTTCSLFLPITK
jgi:hypothetical protein